MWCQEVYITQMFVVNVIEHFLWKSNVDNHS
jgi:hypothetical protein